MLRIWERNSSIWRRRIRIVGSISIRSLRAEDVHDGNFGRFGNRTVLCHIRGDMPSFDESRFDCRMKDGFWVRCMKDEISKFRIFRRFHDSWYRARSWHQMLWLGARRRDTGARFSSSW